MNEINEVGFYMDTDVIIEDEFGIRCNTADEHAEQPYRVGLTKTSLKIGTDRQIRLEDVVGCRVEESYMDNDPRVFILVDTCERINASASRSSRKHGSIRMVVSSGVNKSHNLNVAKKWDRNVKLALQNFNFYQNKKKPFLVFVNPKSGSGKATQLFLKQTVSIWNKANASFEVVLTRKCLWKLNFFNRVVNKRTICF